MEKSVIINKMKLAAQYMLNLSAGDFEETCPVSNIDIDKWEWPQGIGMYGLYRYYTVTGDEEMLKWVFSWYDRHIEKGLPEKNINTVSPLLALTYLYEISPKQEYLDVFSEWAEYIMHNFARTEEDGLEHSGTGRSDLNGQLWDDTLVMTGLFLGRAGIVLNKPEYLAECERQFLLHTKYLCDTESGLWYHGWSFNGRHNFGKAFWGRGNCWITFAIPELLSMTGISESVRMFLTGTLKAQANGLKKYQENSGMWHTLIDHSDSYVEASATSGFGYGILKSVHEGYLPEEYLESGKKAVEAICERIDENGAVGDVSYGTNVSWNLEDYKNIPIKCMPYGQAFAILLLAEACK